MIYTLIELCQPRTLPTPRKLRARVHLENWRSASASHSNAIFKDNLQLIFSKDGDPGFKINGWEWLGNRFWDVDVWLPEALGWFGNVWIFCLSEVKKRRKNIYNTNKN